MMIETDNVAIETPRVRVLPDRQPDQAARRPSEADADGEIALDRLAEALRLDAEQEAL